MTHTDPKPLDKYSRDHIGALLTPLVDSEQERRALLTLTFVDQPLLNQLDFTGSTSTFLAHVMTKLSQFGKLDDGRPALWALLEVVREQVGLEQKHIIDSLRPVFDLPPPPRLDRVFISYSRKNERDAQRIVSDLKDAGLRVWYDREKIKGGEDWWQSIVQGIKNADYFVFCLSPDSIRSKVARDELLTARSADKPIFAVMLQDCLDELKDEVFAEIQWLPKLHIIHFTRPERYGDGLRELIQSLPGYMPPDLYYLEQIAPPDLPNPFRGLEAFLEVDAPYFAGREDTIQDLLTRVQHPDKPRLLAVVGASGSGKSSLVRAGLIPALRQAQPFWQTLTIKPGSNPLDELADRLQERLGALTERTRERLREQPGALDDIAAELLAGRDEARLVLVIDQFEELFTLTSTADCQIFLSLILHALNKPNGKVQLIFTLRSDFFDRLSAVPELAKIVRENLDIATEMTPNQLRRSIESPAHKVGVNYEAGLVEQILEDVRAQPGSLPLLQFALKELFERKLGRRMTQEAYKALGGVKGALATRAEAIYGSLAVSEREALRRILLRLVEVSDESVTRRRVALTDLGFTNIPETVVQGVLDQLTNPEARLLVVSAPLDDDNEANDNQIFYEVSHEALLTHWKRLADWIAENRDDLRRSSEILELARQWNSSGRTETSYLLSGGRLSAAREWVLRGDPIQLQRDFVEASAIHSEQQQQHQLELQQQAFDSQQKALESQRRALNRARLLAGGFAVFLVVALGLLLFAMDQRNQSVEAAIRADNNAATAERSAQDANSVALAANAQVEREKDESLALALALEANAIERPPLFAQAVLSQLAYQGAEQIADLPLALQRGDSLASVVFSPDERYLAVGTYRGILQLWDAETYQLITELKGHQGTIEALAFSPDSRWLLSGGGDLTEDTGELFLWNIETGVGLPMPGHMSQVITVGFMPDGKTAFSSDQENGVIVSSIPEGQTLSEYPAVGNSLGAQTVLSPDGTQIFIFTSLSGVITAWNWQTNEKSVPLELESGHGCQAIALHPDGQRLLCSAALTTPPGVALFDIKTGALLKRYQTITTDVHALMFTRDGSRFATADTGTLRIWDTETEALIHTYYPDTSLFTTIAFNADGSRLVAEGGQGQLGIWDTDLTNSAIIGKPLLTQDELHAFMTTAVITTLGYDASGTTLWVGESGGLRAYDVNEARLYRQIVIEEGVSRFDLLPNGDVIVGTGEGTLLRFNGQSDDPLWTTHAHTRSVSAVVISADGQTVLSGGRDGEILLSNAETGSLIQRFANIPYGVNAVAFTAENTITAIGCAQSTNGSCQQPLLYTWDMADGHLRPDLSISTNNNIFTVSPDGRQALVSNTDNELLLYDILTGTLVQRFIGHESGIYDAQFNQDGTRLLSGGNDQKLIVWDVATGEALRQLDAGVVIMAVAFSPNKREFAVITSDLFSGGSDGEVLRWRLDADVSSLLLWTQENRLPYHFSCSERTRFGFAPTCDANGFAPFSTPFPTFTPTATPNLTQVTATPSRTLTITPTSTLTPTPTATRTPFVQGALPQYGALTGAQWSPDGGSLLASDDTGSVIVWDTATAKERFRVAGERGRWSPNSLFPLLVTSNGETVQLWDANSSAPVRDLTGHSDTIRQLVWSPDGLQLVSISDDGTARVWGRLIGEALTIFDQHSASLTDAAWSPNGTQIVTTAGDGHAFVWEAATGRVLHDLSTGTNAALSGASWSPDGAHIIMTGVDGHATLWDAVTGEAQQTLTPETEETAFLFDAAWSPDGTRVLLQALNGPVSVWDAESGDLLYTLSGHASLISSAAWMPDAPQIVTSSLDGTIRTWDAATGAPVRTMDTRASLWSIALSPDGSQIASVGVDGTARLWAVRAGRERQFIFPPAGSATPTLITPPADLMEAAFRLR